MSAHTRIFFAGQFEPAVNGQSVATADLARLIESRGVKLRRHVTSGAAWKRIWRYLQGAILILIGPERLVYLSVNTWRGLSLNIIMAVAARLRGKSLLAHHHNYAAISRYHPLMAALIRVGGGRCAHLANCVSMARELARRYPGIGEAISLSNIGSVDVALHPSARPARPITVGHMSNLIEEKGADTVIDAVTAMRAAGIEVRLILAGPDTERQAQRQIARARNLLGEAFGYRGPVYGAAKQAFFDAVDIFAFATRYDEETQGIVNLEAMACGKPVVAFAQCCIASDIGEQGGLAVPAGSDFTAALTEVAEAFAQDPDGVSRRARQRFEQLREVYHAEIEHVLGIFMTGRTR